jgi:prophage maintenance system killer protein
MQAAVLAHGPAEREFSLDGIKRVALVAMLTFLEVNGWRVEAEDRRLAQWILDLSEGTIAADLAEKLRMVIAPV